MQSSSDTPVDNAIYLTAISASSWTAASKNGSILLHLQHIALSPGSQPHVGDIIGYLRDGSGAVTWGPYFAPLASDSPSSRLRRFTAALVRALVPLPSKQGLLKYADVLDGAVSTLGIIASALLMMALLSLIATDFAKWALAQQWPKSIIITVGAVIYLYGILQEFRFIGWWLRWVTQRFESFKAR